MATDGQTPPPCNQEIFENGQTVVCLAAKSNAAESWVKAVAKKADARVDWHYSGGIAQVLHLGDDESRTRVEAAIDELEPTLQGTIIQRYKSDESGLCRKGVTQVPLGVVASFRDPHTGKTAYIVKLEDQEKAEK
jgi:hypothetical protein